jgi:hypothetical protein
MENYFSSRKKKGGKMFNKQTKDGMLDKQGRIYKNNLMDSDYTSVTQTIRKLK